MDLLNEVSSLCSSHSDRDKVVCLSTYILKLWGSTSTRKELLMASSRLAAARTTLRLFDDAATIKSFINYGLGKHEGPLWGSLGVTALSSHLIYLQVEKLLWLIDCGLFKVNSKIDHRIRIVHKLLWCLSSSVAFIRSIRTLHLTASELKRTTSRHTQTRFNQSSLITTKAILDVIHSISWLPPGWLWGGKLSQVQMGGVATLSGLTALIIHYHGKRLDPKKTK